MNIQKWEWCLGILVKKSLVCPLPISFCWVLFQARLLSFSPLLLLSTVVTVCKTIFHLWIGKFIIFSLYRVPLKKLPFV